MAHHFTARSPSEYFPLWAQVHVRGELELSPAAIAWMRGRSEAVQALLRQFPPHCVVRLPGPFEVRAVVGYHPAGYLRVCQGLEVPRAQWSWARADRAGLVASWRGLTPQKVAELLEGR